MTLPAEVVDVIAVRAAAIVLERLDVEQAAHAESPYLTVNEAAALLRCRRQRIYELRSSGRLSRLSEGSRALLLRAEVEALVVDEAAR